MGKMKTGGWKRWEARRGRRKRMRRGWEGKMKREADRRLGGEEEEEVRRSPAQVTPVIVGVEHIGGNVFKGIPSAETIFMKCVLHDWDDEHCIKLLRNCWKALPELGKVINVELALPAVLSNDAVSRRAASEDVFMLAVLNGGKERMVAEYADLAKAAGFEETTDFPISIGFHVLEFHKKTFQYLRRTRILASLLHEGWDDEQSCHAQGCYTTAAKLLPMVTVMGAKVEVHDPHRAEVARD
ncbi:hypothetical protein ACLOJK_016219 [Asimina triloba]